MYKVVGRPPVDEQALRPQAGHGQRKLKVGAGAQGGLARPEAAPALQSTIQCGPKGTHRGTQHRVLEARALALCAENSAGGGRFARTAPCFVKAAVAVEVCMH